MNTVYHMEVAVFIEYSLYRFSKVVRIIRYKEDATWYDFLLWFTWTRDSYQGNALDAEYLSAGSGSLSTNRVYGTFGVRPAFVIDLSKVDYTVTGTVNYK